MKTSGLKTLHRQQIYQHYYKYKISGKNQVSESTGISRTTCTEILRDLLEEGFLIQVDNMKSTGGRPGKQYALNKDYAHCCLLLLEIHEQVDLTLQIRNLYSETLDSQYISYEEDDFSLERIRALLQDILVKDSKITSVVFSIPGVASSDGDIITCDISKMAGWRLKKDLEENLQIPIIVENDMNLAVAGYHKQENILAYLYQPRYRSSGCGIMIGENVIRGRSLFAGEISQLTKCTGTEKASQPDQKQTLGILVEQIVALISVLNPDVLVITTGWDYEEKEVIREVESYIPKEHMPLIEISRQLTDHIFAGMMRAALLGKGQMKLIEKQQL